MRSTLFQKEKFDSFDAPKRYCFQRKMQKNNPRQTSINRQSQLDRWFTILHVEQPTAIKQIKMSQQQRKRSKSSKQSADFKFKQTININDRLDLKIDLKQNPKVIKNKAIKAQKQSKQSKQSKQQQFKMIIKTKINHIPSKNQNQMQQNRKEKKPIKLSKPKFIEDAHPQQKNNNKKQMGYKINSKYNNNNNNNNNNIKKQQDQNLKSDPVHKSLSVCQSLESKITKTRYVHPCQYPMRIQRQWQTKSRRKWYSLSKQQMKKAQESMKKMTRQTRPKQKPSDGIKTYAQSQNLVNAKINKFYRQHNENKNVKPKSNIFANINDHIPSQKQFDL